MSPVTNDVVRITQSVNPVPDESVAGSVENDEARLLLARITADPVAARRSGAWLKFGVPAAISMVVVIWLLAVSLLRGGPKAIPDVASPGAGDGSPITIERIAAVAAMQPEVTLPEGGFRYSKSQTRYMFTTAGESFYTVLQSTVREIWIARDGEGRIRTEVGEIEFLTDKDRRKRQAAPFYAASRLTTNVLPAETQGGQASTPKPSKDFPPTPICFMPRSKKRAEGRGPGLYPEMFVIVGDMLRETGAPPELRSALFRVAARIPGVEINENASDPTGRPGVAVSHTHDPGGRMMRNELIFDKQTSALLSEGQFVGEKTANVGPTGRPDKMPAEAPAPAVGDRDFYGDLAPGTQVGGAVYLESGIVDSVEERPGG